MKRPVVIASNRGPVSFEIRDDELIASRGAGGLVSGLGPLVQDTDTQWYAAALSEGDRRAGATGTMEAAGFMVRIVDIDRETLDGAYNTIANGTLWYLYHGLNARSREPIINIDWYDAWSAFRRYNAAFAEALIDGAPENSIVLLQDHHLALVAPRLRDERPDVSTVHFSHTPFATPDALRILPELARTELMFGYLGADAIGFHSSRWSDDFIAGCRETLGVRPTNTFVSPLGPDPAQLRAFSESPACEVEHQSLIEEVGDRVVIARAERLELSKNLLRGFLAYDELLALRPELHEEIVFVANLAPSRTDLDDYISYREEIEAAVDEINARWRTPTWTPIIYRAENNFARAVAMFRRYDLLLVNSIRDGLNLVAKEGPLINERNGIVALSRETGAFDELSGLVTEVHAYDITQTAQAMSDALNIDAETKAEIATDLVAVIESRTPKEWLQEQLAAAVTPD